jgi:hypothetical protein
VLFAAVADSAAITGATTTEQQFSTATLAIAASELKVGDVLRVRGRAVVTGKNASETLTVKVVVGGTGLSGGSGSDTVLSTGAINNSAADEAYFDTQVQIRTIGATGTATAGGIFVDGAPGTATAKAASMQSTAINTAVSVPVWVTATWSGSSATNTVVLRELVVELIRQ